MTDQLQSFSLSQRALRTKEQPIGYLMAQALYNPALISLAAGFVDYQTLPAKESSSLINELLADPVLGERAMQYGTSAGLNELRHQLLEHMAKLDGMSPSDLDASPDDVVITTGSQQLLFVLTDLLVDVGDIVITEWPSYFVYTGTLTSAGAQVRAVEMDDQGMIPEKLESLLAEIANAGQLHRVKIVYTCDYHQNPTGITLSQERRPQILDIVRKYSPDHRILLLEDAAYRELTYEGESPRSIKSYDTNNEFVALAQTFSKPFAPGLKTGYGLLPRDLVEPALLQKGNHDFGSNNLSLHVLSAAMRDGTYAQHVDVLKRTYANKRDAMLRALDKEFGKQRDAGEVRWTQPTGGLYVYLTLANEEDTGRSGKLFQRALSQGVLYVPGSYCFGPDETRTAPTNTMRLSFGVPTIENIQEGIKRLSAAVQGN